MMYAVAISNNDMVYLYWHVEAKIPKCLGFSVIRHDVKTGKGEPLPAMVGFPSRDGVVPKFRDTNAWPIQKYSWKDVYAKRGGTYWYEIVPMLGKPGHHEPDFSQAMRTNSVSLDSRRGNCSVFFNRGIISTQAIARNLPKSRSGLPSSQVLKKRIEEPADKLRIRLTGDLAQGIVSLLERADGETDGKFYCALYELSDRQLLESLMGLKKKVQIVLSNAGEDTKEASGDGDSTNCEAREELHASKMDVVDRMFKKGHIGHNKFVVYANKRGPQAVLTGSTNWTPTGLCAQSNNAIVIESPELAAEYHEYWKDLWNDSKKADGDPTALQRLDFRTANKTERPSHDLIDSGKSPHGNVRVWFSPNTRQKTVPRRKKKDGGPAADPPTPPDLKEVFQLIEQAKQGALFLAFIPGNPSIVSKLKQVYDEKRNAGELFYLRGAATSPDPASVFRVDLYHRSSRAESSVRPVESLLRARASAKVASVAGIYTAFAQWEAELYKVGHAVIHDKTIVIDPFTDDSVVVTGSHNLGFKASYSNDENLLIIRGNREIAEAYAAHVLDVYEHYRWRWRLQQPLRDAFNKAKEKHPEAKAADIWQEVMKSVGHKEIQKAWHSLDLTDHWQDFYEKYKDFLAAEVNFWSPFGGVARQEGKPRDPVAASAPRRSRPR